MRSCEQAAFPKHILEVIPPASTPMRVNARRLLISRSLFHRGVAFAVSPPPPLRSWQRLFDGPFVNPPRGGGGGIVSCASFAIFSTTYVTDQPFSTTGPAVVPRCSVSGCYRISSQDQCGRPGGPACRSGFRPYALLAKASDRARFRGGRCREAGSLVGAGHDVVHNYIATADLHADVAQEICEPRLGVRDLLD